MQRTFKELNQISKQLYKDPFVVKNFIDADQVNTCLELYYSLPVFAAASHARATRKDYLMHNAERAVTRDIFLPKLQNLWPGMQLKIAGGNFTDWHHPVGVHTDGFQLAYNPIDEIEQNQEVLGFAVLVPLGTDTGKGKPYTLFFNQKKFGEAGHQGNKSHENDSNKIVNFSDIENYTYKDFDKSSEYYSMIDHLADDKLHGFTVQTAYEWFPGDAIIWHRGQFHCASKFEEYNSKLHLVFFMNFLNVE